MHPDSLLIRKYCQKENDAKTRGIEFSLSFQSFKNLHRAKKCYYTGVLLTDPAPGGIQSDTSRTIDRIDSTKGYVHGNVVACTHIANRFKSYFECQKNRVSIEGIQHIVNTLKSIK